MNDSNTPLDRLLRGAAAARRSAAPEFNEAPSAAALMSRNRVKDPIAPAAFLILRRGLVAACALLVITAVITVREIRGQQRDINIIEKTVQFTLSGVFVP